MKSLSFKNGFSRLLFWSVISAAFIGPGTVTTCSLAGATFGTSLLWALTFSTLATIVLQEAAARLTLASTQSLGEILVQRHGLRGRWLNRLLAGGVILGCGAYEAGNLLGAVAGVRLILAIPIWSISLVLGIAAYFMLSIRNISLLTRLLGVLVFILGFAFIVVSLGVPENPLDIVANTVLPQFPQGSALLITGLIGTTIVPYNLFLGSGIGQGQTVSEMRQGLIPAIVIGGLVSMAIVVAGTLIEGEFSFPNAAQVLGERLGTWGEWLYALGLFGAGFTSLVTAPLAASITAKTLLSTTDRQTSYVWKGVLLLGVIFGIAQFKPVPVILAAQVANGLLLPFVTWQLFRCLNDRQILPEAFINSRIQNILFLLIFLVTLYLSGNTLYAVLK
ncbi:Nramp family divalent metal transporter [Salmonirosea aquatica]|uniref:Divalent metal cation transporter n=1 Tax=Salmonirosea aquatica TaxID=2654236 RepID=A0A7C9FRQ3_9BACT|nr:divalent metal cation transporter [Cytophagaceae bacterium SJW1-29]